MTQSSREEKKKHNNSVLLAKIELNTDKFLISKTLIDSYIDHDEFVSVNSVLGEYHKMK